MMRSLHQLICYRVTKPVYLNSRKLQIKYKKSPEVREDEGGSIERE
jgi:hypothetical protein